MHWADRLSVLLLTHLCSELADSRVGVVISFRPRHPGPLRDGLDRLIRARSVTHVTLDGLASADIRAWLREYPDLQRQEDLADQLRERTAGNPLLIRLLVEAMLAHPAVADGRLEEGTDGQADARAVDRILAQRADLRRLVAARTDTLSPPTREILQAASVLGERVTPTVLSQVVD
jgi:predicted ATPase